MVSGWFELALRQAGGISLHQLLDRGESEYSIRRLVAGGGLRRVSRGVYLVVGIEGGWKQDLWVGLLAAGPSAFACRRTAGVLWALDGIERGDVEIGVGEGHAPRRPGTARLGSLGPGDVTDLDGIAVTTVARTLVDLTSVVAPSVVERSLECALRRGLVPSSWAHQPEVPPGSRAGRVLRDIVAARPAGAPPTESDAETLFAQLVRRAGLAAPERQVVVRLGGRTYRLDFAWRRLRLAVEIDGASVHGPDRLGADLRRQNHIILDGWMILRFTWYMVAKEPAGVAGTVREAWNLRLIATAG
jgi:very-short-patch-repair endonuclease